MFKLFFKHRGKSAAIEQKLAMQREMERRRKMELRHESALKANIADKLRGYNAEDDNTISNFTLAEDEVERKLADKSAASGSRDVWGQADPREAARWKKENRMRKDRRR